MSGIKAKVRASGCVAWMLLLGVCPAVAASERVSFSLALADSMTLGSFAAQPANPDSARVSEFTSQETNQETGESPEQADRCEVPPFGEKGCDWWSISASGMADDDDNRDFSLRLGYHNFIAEDFEFNAALTGWYHDQPNDNEFSGSFDIGFRYHFWVEEKRKDWTVYADIGIGLLLSSGEVPEGGTDVNFTPRAGVGLTMRLPDGFGGEAGGRLDLGVGWQHFSNASSAGSDRNPARDSIIVRAGVMFPF
jgi:hypothetical protein